MRQPSPLRKRSLRHRLAQALAITSLLLAIACGSSAERPLQPPETLRFLALGDSYTVGEGVSLEDSWPAQLVGRLNTSGLRVAEPEIIARTGWTTGELADAIDRIAPTGPYNLVILQIGVNNQFRGGSAEKYRPELASLLETANNLAGNSPSRVVVVSIPDWGVTRSPKTWTRTRLAVI